MTTRSRPCPPWLLFTRLALMLSIGGVLTAIIAVLVTAGMRDELTVGVDAGALAALGTPAGTELTDDSVLTVRLTAPSWGQAALYAVARLPELIIAFAVLVVLLRVVNDAIRVDPFTRGTVRRLRRLGVGAAVAGTTAGLVQVAATWALADTVDRGVQSGVVTLNWILLGLGALAIAEVINRGVAMREELDEVI